MALAPTVRSTAPSASISPAPPPPASDPATGAAAKPKRPVWLDVDQVLPPVKPAQYGQLAVAAAPYDHNSKRFRLAAHLLSDVVAPLIARKDGLAAFRLSGLEDYRDARGRWTLSGHPFVLAFGGHRYNPGDSLLAVEQWTRFPKIVSGGRGLHLEPGIIKRPARSGAERAINAVFPNNIVEVENRRPAPDATEAEKLDRARHNKAALENAVTDFLATGRALTLCVEGTTDTDGPTWVRATGGIEAASRLAEGAELKPVPIIVGQQTYDPSRGQSYFAIARDPVTIAEGSSREQIARALELKCAGLNTLTLHGTVGAHLIDAIAAAGAAPVRFTREQLEQRIGEFIGALRQSPDLRLSAVEKHAQPLPELGAGQADVRIAHGFDDPAKLAPRLGQLLKHLVAQGYLRAEGDGYEVVKAKLVPLADVAGDPPSLRGELGYARPPAKGPLAEDEPLADLFRDDPVGCNGNQFAQQALALPALGRIAADTLFAR